jgi:hypothetical protein
LPNLVVRKIWNACQLCLLCPSGLAGLSHILPLAGPLKPLPQKVLAIAVQGGRVPVHAAQLVGAVEQREAFLVGRGCPVEA